MIDSNLWIQVAEGPRSLHYRRSTTLDEGQQRAHMRRSAGVFHGVGVAVQIEVARRFVN